MTGSEAKVALEDLPLFDAWDAPEFSAETDRASEELFGRVDGQLLRGSDGSVLFFRNEDVRTIAATPDVTHQSTESMAALLQQIGATETDGLLRFVDQMTFSMRPPEHLPTKQLSSRRLSAQGVARLVADATAATQRQLSRLADGTVIDLNRDLVGPVVVAFWNRVLGVTEDEGGALLDAMGDLSTGFRLGGDAQQFAAASRGCDRYMEILPQALAREAEGGHRPMLAELAADFEADSAGIRPRDPFVVFAAALADSFMTLPALVTNATYGLLSNEQSLASVRADQTLVQSAFLEGSRLNPPIIYTRREAARDFAYANCLIPQGTAVSILWFCANRDPGVFHEPAAYKLERENRARQTTFGRGLYACVGRHLAKLLCETVLAALTAPPVQVALAEDVAWMRGHTLREIERLAVTITKA
jgi:cytochrome P450